MSKRKKEEREQRRDEIVAAVEEREEEVAAKRRKCMDNSVAAAADKQLRAKGVVDNDGNSIVSPFVHPRTPHSVSRSLLKQQFTTPQSSSGMLRTPKKPFTTPGASRRIHYPVNRNQAGTSRQHDQQMEEEVAGAFDMEDMGLDLDADFVMIGNERVQLERTDSD